MKKNKGGFLWISLVLQRLFTQAKKFTCRYVYKFDKTTCKTFFSNYNQHENFPI